MILVFYRWEVMILVLMEMVASIFLLSEAVECGLLGTTCWLRLELDGQARVSAGTSLLLMGTMGGGGFLLGCIYCTLAMIHWAARVRMNRRRRAKKRAEAMRQQMEQMMRRRREVKPKEDIVVPSSGISSSVAAPQIVQSRPNAAPADPSDPSVRNPPLMENLSAEAVMQVALAHACSEAQAQARVADERQDAEAAVAAEANADRLLKELADEKETEDTKRRARSERNALRKHRQKQRKTKCNETTSEHGSTGSGSSIAPDPGASGHDPQPLLRLPPGAELIDLENPHQTDLSTAQPTALDRPSRRSDPKGRGSSSGPTHKGTPEQGTRADDDTTTPNRFGESRVSIDLETGEASAVEGVSTAESLESPGNSPGNGPAEAKRARLEQELALMHQEVTRLCTSRDDALLTLSRARADAREAEWQANQECKALHRLEQRREHLEVRTAKLESHAGAIERQSVDIQALQGQIVLLTNAIRQTQQEAAAQVAHTTRNASQALHEAQLSRNEVEEELSQARAQIAMLAQAQLQPNLSWGPSGGMLGVPNPASAAGPAVGVGDLPPSTGLAANQPAPSTVARDAAWADTHAVIAALLAHVAKRPIGWDSAPHGFMTYGARAINANLAEEGLHLETKDYDFMLVADTVVAFEEESQAVLQGLQNMPELHNAEITGDGTTAGYLHIAVHRNRVADISHVPTADMVRWLHKYGAPQLMSMPCPGAPPVVVMPLGQLHDRLLATTTGDVQLAQHCFPEGFDPRNVPAWRIEKDRRQLQRIKIAHRLTPG